MERAAGRRVAAPQHRPDPGPSRPDPGRRRGHHDQRRGGQRRRRRRGRRVGRRRPVRLAPCCSPSSSPCWSAGCSARGPARRRGAVHRHPDPHRASRSGAARSPQPHDRSRLNPTNAAGILSEPSASGSAPSTATGSSRAASCRYMAPVRCCSPASASKLSSARSASSSARLPGPLGGHLERGRQQDLPVGSRHPEPVDLQLAHPVGEPGGHRRPAEPGRAVGGVRRHIPIQQHDVVGRASSSRISGAAARRSRANNTAGP